MTGNKIAWRAPLAGLASFAMVATMGVAASTANAAFKPAEQAAKYTVTLDVSKQAGATLGDGVLDKLKDLDANNDFTEKTDDKTDVEVTLNSTKAEKATKATIENVAADTEVSTLVADPAVVANREFVAWQVGGVAADTDSAKVTGNLDLTGRYAYGTPVTITFDQAVENRTVKLVSGDKLADWQVGKVAADGNQIKGWNTDRTATEAMDLSTLDTSKNQTLYPIWATTYTVTYKYGKDYTQEATQKVASGAAFTAAKEVTDVAPAADQKFAGWNTLKDASKPANDDNFAEFDTSKGTTKDVTLYAKYAAQPDYAKVTFMFQASKNLDGTDVAAAEYGSDAEVVKGTAVAKPADPADPTDQGRPFAYWTTEQNTTADQAKAKAYAWSTPVTDDVTLYAVFGDATKTAASKVTFDEKWQDGAITEVESNEDGTFTVADPVREGYTFKGWATKDGEILDLSDAEAMKGVTTLYAVWQDQAEADYNQASKYLGDYKNMFTKKSYDAYQKVFNKYFDVKNVTNDEGKVIGHTTVLKDKSKKDEATKAVLAAQGKLVENTPEEVHRVYNPNNGDHYFTTSSAVAANLKTLGWTYEGVKFNTASGYNGLNEALYSVYNANTGEHLLAFEAEADFLATQGWAKENIVMFTLANGPKDVYRAYNPNTNGPAHVYVEKGEAEALARLGWSIDNAGEPVFKLK